MRGIRMLLIVMGRLHANWHLRLIEFELARCKERGATLKLMKANIYACGFKNAFVLVLLAVSTGSFTLPANSQTGSPKNGSESEATFVSTVAPISPPPAPPAQDKSTRHATLII